ncbi:MAG: GNAT family N-acetyltransferase [Nonlabens sp.]
MNEEFGIAEMTDEDWNNKSLGTSLFCSTQWNRLFVESYGLTYQKIVNSENEIVAYFCVIEHEFSHKISLLPFCDYVDFERLKSDYVQPVVNLLGNRYPNYDIILKSTFDKTELPADVKILHHSIYHRIELDAGHEVKTKASFRSKINKARKKFDLHSRCNYERTAIADFYEMYKNLRFSKFKSIPQPLSFFLNLWESFIKNKKGFTLEVLHNNHVIASAIILEHNNILYYKYSCSDPNSLNMAPNNFLMHELTNHAMKNNFQAVDLGSSGLSDEHEGLRKYKESCGGTAYPITFIGVKNHQNPSPTEKNSNLINTITSTMVDQNLSLKETSALSEIIYPYFA